jgi:hypothetical protein
MTHLVRAEIVFVITAVVGSARIRGPVVVYLGLALAAAFFFLVLLALVSLVFLIVILSRTCA